MQLLQHFKDLTVHPKNAEELKGLILQLAIQGKLTKKWREQNPDVEPASVLLEKIQAEKAQLIKEKKIKKEKALPEIEEDEIPYELPDDWTWCRLNEVCVYIQRGKSPKYTEEPKIPVISQKCVQWSGFDISRARYITEKSLEKYGPERFLQKGDLLWNSTGDGTIGRVISYPGSDYEKVVADSHVTIVRSFTEYVASEYLWIFTASPLIQNLVAGRVSGSTKQTELGTGTVKQMEFSFPPLEEQKAIVEIVNQLFREVEALEQQTKARVQLKEDFVTSALQQLTTGDTTAQWSFLQNHFKSFFTEKTGVKKLRESILQLAVQGKLTSHWRANNPDVEPASVLLDKIKAEKAELIKDKKIKKEKPLPKITEDEIPYELPGGWTWCYLGESMLKVTDGTHHSPPNVENGAFKYVSAKNIKNDGVQLSNITYVTKERHEEIYARCNPEIGDLLYIKDGATTGICCINDLDEEFSMLSSVALLKQPKGVVGHYLLTVLRSPYYYELMRAGMSGVAITRVTLKKLKESIIPLPPLEEQKAMVEKVNALMGLCDSLEQEIEHSTTQVELLMKSCLREVFEN